jgi:hypothetical protein
LAGEGAPCQVRKYILKEGNQKKDELNIKEKGNRK